MCLYKSSVKIIFLSFKRSNIKLLKREFKSSPCSAISLDIARQSLKNFRLENFVTNYVHLRFLKAYQKFTVCNVCWYKIMWVLTPKTSQVCSLWWSSYSYSCSVKKSCNLKLQVGRYMELCQFIQVHRCANLVLLLILDFPEKSNRYIECSRPTQNKDEINLRLNFNLWKLSFGEVEL